MVHTDDSRVTAAVRGHQIEIVLRERKNSPPDAVGAELSSARRLGICAVPEE